MIINALTTDKLEYLTLHALEKKYEKAKKLFESNPNHPSLHTECLEPKHLKLYSFRLDKKYRVVFIVKEGIAEVITITNHYK